MTLADREDKFQVKYYKNEINKNIVNFVIYLYYYAKMWSNYNVGKDNIALTPVILEVRL